MKNSTVTRKRSFRSWLKKAALPNDKKVVSETLLKDGVFGIPLLISIQYARTSVGYIDDDGKKHTKAGSIPIIVAKCGSYLKKNGLETEGIFRVSGSIKRINELQSQFDSSKNNYGIDLNWDSYTVHDAATILRRFLNKLPDPVIPFGFYHQFRDIMNDKTCRDTDNRIKAYQQLIQQLPTSHQHLLLYLLDTLSLFAAYASQTKMTISNLAAVFCPGMLRHPDHNTPVQYKISQYVIEFLIEFQSLFTMQLLMPKQASTFEPKQLLLTSAYHPPRQQPPSPVLHRVDTPRQSPKPTPKPISTTPSSIIQTYKSQLALSLDSPETSPQVQTRGLPISNQQQSFVHNVTNLTSIQFNIFKQNVKEYSHQIRPLIGYLTRQTVFLYCLFGLFTTLIIYKIYLAFIAHTFESFVFFFSFTFYCYLLYSTLPPQKENKETEMSEILNDENIMSEWGDLLQRSWKNKDSDVMSICSKSSRFDEDEEQQQDSDSEEEDIGFDADLLSSYLAQFDQIKKDEQLAKKLQLAEQRARDSNNPFIEQATDDKEEWKIRIFSR